MVITRRRAHLLPEELYAQAERYFDAKHYAKSVGAHFFRRKDVGESAIDVSRKLRLLQPPKAS
jgi:hypothetical protein